MLTIEQQQLVEENIKLSYFFANKWAKKLPKMEIDELISLASLGLVKAAQAFKPEKGFAFATFADRCIGNIIKKHLRDNKKHFVVDQTKLHLDAPIKNQYDKDITSYDLLVKNDDTFDLVLLNEVISKLDELKPRERLIFEKLVFEGCRQRELTELIGVQQVQISRLFKKALNQIKEQFAEEVV